MSSFAPKFCPTHLKIHVCELQNVFNKNKEIEEDIGAKVRRLHGTQTEEELKLEDKKRINLPGTLGDILEKAKLKIQEQKDEIKKINDEEEKEVSEIEIGDRMAALRAKMMGESIPYSPPELNIKSPSNKKVNSKIIEKQEFVNDENIINETSLEVEKKEKKSLNKKSQKLFTQEETQELIQIAVKEALKQVGIIDNDGKKKKDIIVKKASSNKKSTKPINNTNKKTSQVKKTTTSKNKKS